MRLLHEIAIFQTVKSKVTISLLETVRLSVSISLRNFYISLNSIKQIVARKIVFKEYYPAFSNAPDCIRAFEMVPVWQQRV